MRTRARVTSSPTWPPVAAGWPVPLSIGNVAPSRSKRARSPGCWPRSCSDRRTSAISTRPSRACPRRRAVNQASRSRWAISSRPAARRVAGCWSRTSSPGPVRATDRLDRSNGTTAARSAGICAAGRTHATGLDPEDVERATKVPDGGASRAWARDRFPVVDTRSGRRAARHAHATPAPRPDSDHGAHRGRPAGGARSRRAAAGGAPCPPPVEPVGHRCRPRRGAAWPAATSPPAATQWRERNPWLAFEDAFRTVRGFVQRLEGGHWGRRRGSAKTCRPSPRGRRRRCSP